MLIFNGNSRIGHPLKRNALIDGQDAARITGNGVKHTGKNALFMLKKKCQSDNLILACFIKWKYRADSVSGRTI